MIYPRGKQIDLLVTDKNGQIIVVGEARTHPTTRAYEVAEHLTHYLGALPDPVPFILVVDLEKIEIFGWNGRSLSGPLLVLPTDEILRPYDPDFGSRRIFEPFLITLVEAWLRDLAYRWKSETPPGCEAVAKIGLLPLLEGGATKSEVTLTNGHLRRD